MPSTNPYNGQVPHGNLAIIYPLREPPIPAHSIVVIGDYRIDGIRPMARPRITSPRIMGEATVPNRVSKISIPIRIYHAY